MGCWRGGSSVLLVRRLLLLRLLAVLVRVLLVLLNVRVESLLRVLLLLLLVVVGWVLLSKVGTLGRGRVVVLLRLASLTVVWERLLGISVRGWEEGRVYWACCSAGCHRGRGGRWGVGLMASEGGHVDSSSPAGR